MLRQYQHIKSQYKDCILFFRLGDFYEMFYDDARTASKILDLVLTSRGTDKSGKAPMCGIPYHSAENYITRLIKAGQKVAICEQTEDPAQAKGIVRRDVIRVITAGTFIDNETADTRYLLCLATDKKAFGLAFCDAASGRILANQYGRLDRILELAAKLPVAECLFPESHTEDVRKIFRHPLLSARHIPLSPFEDWAFNPEIARKGLCEHFAVHTLKGFGIEDLPLAVSAAGALLEYFKQMNQQPLKHIDRVALYTDGEFCYISPAACYGLELERLRQALDRTVTAPGRRKFRDWLYHPLKDAPAIHNRQQAVELLKDDPACGEELHRRLKPIPDIEKHLSRLGCGYTCARDMLALRTALAAVPGIREILYPLNEKNLLFSVTDIPELRERLTAAINPDMPLANPQGRIIRPGFNTDLDGLRDLQANGHRWLKEYQQKEAKRTGIPSLKVGFNKIFGYYIEVTKTHLKSVPAEYIRKQTLVNAERYITPELKEFEEKILSAEEKITRIEDELLKDIRQEILAAATAVHTLSENIATVDVLYSLALLARQKGFVKPAVTTADTIDITEGRHPVVEQLSLEPFVANDTLLDCEANHLAIITGPNMSGKSTYIRQTAILVIMAQMGGFIPARSATIGIVDKIFTRIGAHDDISKGQSTFMVEMSEAADILNNLSPRSLVILDEIGRGTSTYDGLSLAWALAEHLQAKKVRTLFATHFHELTALADEFSGVVNYNVAVKKWGDDIVFLHKIVPGGTDDSYGIYVAKLAGIPRDVLKRAEQILAQLELHSNLKDHIRLRKPPEEQLSLFSGHTDPIMGEIKKELQALDINTLTPVEALNTLQEFKKKMEKD